MKSILITGADSYIGNSLERWLSRFPDVYHVDVVDTLHGGWREADFSGYDVVFHVAGIAHVDPRADLAPLYYKVNRDLPIEVASLAKAEGVKQFIYVSSMMVYHASKSLDSMVINADTEPAPNEFYGDSKLQAEMGLKQLESADFKIALLRPCMVYGPGCKGNFPRLVKLARLMPVFPDWHNKRAMLYIDNLCEAVRQVIDRGLGGVFHLQNRELADTVEIVRYFAAASRHPLWCTRLLNPVVRLSAPMLKAVCKMFSDLYYDPTLTTYDFDYQLVSFAESLKRIKP